MAKVIDHYEIFIDYIGEDKVSPCPIIPPDYWTLEEPREIIDSFKFYVEEQTEVTIMKHAIKTISIKPIYKDQK